MWEIPAAALAGGLALWRGLAGTRKRREQGRRTLGPWVEAAAQCGLRVVNSSNSPLVLQARQGEMQVSIEGHGGDPIRTRIVVTLSGPLDGFKLCRESSPPGKSRDLATGDKAFDSTFGVEGPAPLVRALLNVNTRRLLLWVNAEAPLEISWGVLWADVADPQVPHVLPLLLEVGQHFRQPGDAEVVERLVKNARRDPKGGVRLQNLLLLARDFRGDPRTAEALRVACSDASPEVRLRAALELGPEGHEVLLELAGSVELEDAEMAQVVASLGPELPVGRMQGILDRALSRGRSRTIHTCLEALSRSEDPAAVEALAKTLGRQTDELAAAAARALGATGSASAEPPLVAALERERDVRLAAAEALGRLGSAAAVLPLQEAAAHAWADHDLNRAARQAIAEIQSRLQGASPGQLSLAGPEAGRLSIATDSAGDLSLMPAEAGQPQPLTGPPE